jgi:signal transduction histidine kinase
MFKVKNRSVIEISDNGRGINMRIIDNIFQPGFSTKKYGWGLGLTLTKRIIKDYFSGKIFVKNTKKGKGSTFRIDLPYCEV